jgi:hypothetical protein
MANVTTTPEQTKLVLWRLLEAAYRTTREQAESKIWWLLERSGNERTVYGPYTLWQAAAQEGFRYLVIRGSGLQHGMRMDSDDVEAAFQSGRVC